MSSSLHLPLKTLWTADIITGAVLADGTYVTVYPDEHKETLAIAVFTPGARRRASRAELRVGEALFMRSP